MNKEEIVEYKNQKEIEIKGRKYYSKYYVDMLEKLSKEKDKEIEKLNKEVEKYKKRCYEALRLIRDNYGVLDKYGIDLLDDILNGK